MNVYVPHPRLLVALLLAVALGFSAYAVYAQSREPAEGSGITGATHIPPIGAREIPALLPEELEAARTVANAHPVFAAAFAANPANAEYAAPRSQKVYIEDEPVGVIFHAVFAAPVTLSGPWPFMDCGAPAESRTTYYDVVTLIVVVDLTTSSVIGMQPLDARADPAGLAEDRSSRKCPVPSND